MSPLQVAKSSGELAFVPCVPMLRDCSLCLLGNLQTAPSYRWLIQWAVGDLLPRSGSDGGGGDHGGYQLVLLFPLSDVPTTSAQRRPGPVSRGSLQPTQS